jgi:hypothetical protein
MYYLYSLFTFIFYYIAINIYESIIIKLNKYKQLFQYKIIYETFDFIFIDPLCFGLFILPVYVQNFIMTIIILYVIKDLVDFYLEENKSNNIIIIKTYRILLGIFIAIDTILTSDIYIITSIFNTFSLLLLFNDYQVMICNSFTNS